MIWHAWHDLLTREFPSLAELIAKHGFFQHQVAAFDRILGGRSVFMTSGTSSGKTWAVALPLLHQLRQGQRRKIAFLLPTRALLEAQRDTVGGLAEATGLRWGDIRGGLSLGRLLDACAADVWFATPDALYWFFHRRGRHAGALAWALMQVDDFVFDELHVFSSYSQHNLRWFIERLRALNPRARFHFLSATVNDATFRLFSRFGDYGDAPIQGQSFTGQIDLDVRELGLISSKRAREQLMQMICTEAGDRHTVVILNSARAVHQIWLDQVKDWEQGGVKGKLNGFSGPVYRYTGYLEKRRRDGLIEEFTKTGGLLLSTSAVEVGVDFDCDRLFTQVRDKGSTVQRVGRAGRAGRNARVTVLTTALTDGAVRAAWPDDLEIERDEAWARLRAQLPSDHDEPDELLLAQVAQCGVNLQLGETGRDLNQRMFPEHGEQLQSITQELGFYRYGLRPSWPAVRLGSERSDVSAEPLYILSLAPPGTVHAIEGDPFTMARVDRVYDQLVFQWPDIGVYVDDTLTLNGASLVDAGRERIGLWKSEHAPLIELADERFPTQDRPKRVRLRELVTSPALRFGQAKLALACGDVALRRKLPRAGWEPLPRPLLLNQWFFLVLAGPKTAIQAFRARLEARGQSAAFDAAVADLEGLWPDAEDNLPARTYYFLVERTFGAALHVWYQAQRLAARMGETAGGC